MSTDPLARWRDDRSRAFAAEDPNAGLCWFATHSARSGPAVRCLVLRDLGTDHGFAVFLNASSPKAADLATDARIEVACWYPSIQVQVRATGHATPLPAGLLDDHWPKRPEPGRRLDHLYAGTFRQSTPVDPSAFAAAHAAVPEAVLDTRPDGVGGRLLAVRSVERLHLGEGLHERLRWVRAAEGWTEERLVP